MSFWDWPGKSPVGDELPAHPAVYHMLDVAAVAEHLIEPFALVPPLRAALVLLVALHDLGKISDSFRAMLAGAPAQGPRHWELTEVLLHQNDAHLAERLGGDPDLRWQLYAAVAGHHGRPPDLAIGALPKPARVREFGLAMHRVGSGAAPAAEVIEAFCDLWPGASLDVLDLVDATRLSWWLPGLCACADWVGSNTRWFTAQTPDLPLFDYLAQARQVSTVAVAEAGLGGTVAQPGPLFDFALRPMQAACTALPLPDGPMLAVIEDETGAGKTEAALILAHRMALAGKGRGLYFALPTMATADAMFRRSAQIVGRIFAAPTLTLAHGRAGLSADFRDLVSGDARGEDDPSCTDWLAESRRRALLADVGVGTIDQALMAVLPVKHQTLRHFGLSSKILIVDEVHEMGEAYIAKELERLLQMHRAAGGSAIVLTATLPLALREKLLATYGGKGVSPAYPALTVAGGPAVSDFAADPRPVKGPVTVARIETVAAAVDHLVTAAGQGAACVFVRNSVDEAIAAREALLARGIPARLLHARFALCDRKRIEAEVLATVGKTGQGRAGFVLVGTQVLESSLDLDFDVMISDLAPIAALIQRAGRLWRHMEERPAAARPVAAPVLHVLSPDPAVVADDRWLRGTLGRGAFVYDLADVWRTARVLSAAGRIEAPQGLRALIEAVHGEAAEPVPEALTRAETEALGKAAAARTQAVHNLVDLSRGYRDGGGASPDTSYPTRLGGPTRTLVLARHTASGLAPWAEGADLSPAEAWALSEVSARAARLDALPLPDQTTPQIVAATRDWPDWRRAEVRLCPVADDGTICKGLRYDRECGLVFEGVTS
ncbi:CRISPR-associated helicase/endonuclease Cas3 [Rhodobacter maris]|uniref:CRISPR-associated Cas3 family helicase n=1 Tax=Rhodobacter maris TaxID=446682 RepID=A0A285STP7_9RHOB|nr:CRISPR-associated helicase/endonuclease Cas3 [Rhodobacter maris]SOC11122.1 CRISPR-associated Cas3 family helicase [Rhodobacter maris]